MTAGDNAAQSSQRIDRWLWQARFFKTRTIAAKFVSEGNIRVTRNDATLRAEKPSFLVREGDVLVFSRRDHLRIIAILALATRRGPAAEAQSLYEDQSPPRPPKAERIETPFAREKGAGAHGQRRPRRGTEKQRSHADLTSSSPCLGS